MKFDVRHCLLVAGLSVGVMGSSAMAQVAPPPTKPAKEEVKYEAPEKKAAPEPAAQPAEQPAEQPANQPANQPKLGTKIDSNSSASSAAGSLPINTPYPKLAQRGPDGKIIRLVELPDILAMRSNPTIGQKSMKAIMPIIFGRRARFEYLVMDNLDLYWMVTDGRLDEISFDNMGELATLTEMIKPLVGRTTLSQELQNRGILTRVQGGMNEYIVNEYKQAVTEEIQFNYDDPMGEVLRFILLDSIHETKMAYNAMIAELSSQIGTIVTELGLTSEAALNLAKIQRPLNTDVDGQQSELAEFDALFRQLSYEDAVQILTAMRNHRKHADRSPAIGPINVMHALKIDISDKDSLHGTINYPSGRVVNTKEAAEEYDKRIEKEKEAWEEGQNPSSDD